MVIFLVIKIYYTQRTHHLFSFVFVCVEDKLRYLVTCVVVVLLLFIMAEKKSKKKKRKKIPGRKLPLNLEEKKIFPEPNFQNKTGKKRFII